MRKVLIVTRIDFWTGGAGHKSRLSSLIRYFKQRIDITVAFAGEFDGADAAILTRDYPEIQVDVITEDNQLSYKEYGERFVKYIKGKDLEVVLFEYLDFSFVLPSLGDDVVTILDTHDLLSDRRESFLKCNLPCDGIELSFAEEIEIFKCFDHVIAIQQRDYEKILPELGPGCALLAPHPVECRKRDLREKVSTIGYVASDYDPNVDAIVWFLDNVWPSIHERFGISLEIFGGVCSRLPNNVSRKPTGANLRYFVGDLESIYSTCDIMINPIRCGSGLKIKNVEALANGLPLVTTSHGALGIDEGAGSAFTVANSPEEFVQAIEQLVVDRSHRLSLSANALRYAGENFTADRCYRDLQDILLSVKSKNPTLN
jgi:glycosyltransferase involved in cell wall biosynthesis